MHAEFEDYVKIFPNNLIKYNIDQLANDFFNRVDNIHTKHCVQWHGEYLYLTLVEDSNTCTYVANQIIALTIPSLELEYRSDAHNTTINIEAALSFIIHNNTPESQYSNEYFINYRDAIAGIVEGEKLWSEDSNCMQKFRQCVTRNRLNVSTNTHGHFFNNYYAND